MSESAEADGLLDALRDRVLRRLLTVYGFGAVTIGGLFALRALQAGVSSTRMWAMLAASQSVWLLRALHPRLGFRGTALAFLAYLWALPTVLQLYRGLTPGAPAAWPAMLAAFFAGGASSACGLYRHPAPGSVSRPAPRRAGDGRAWTPRYARVVPIAMTSRVRRRVRRVQRRLTLERQRPHLRNTPRED